MNLEILKQRFQKALGIVDHELTDDELIQIYLQIRKTKPSERTEANLQSIVTSITGIDSFLLTEALDNSDIDDMIDQIEDALKNRR